MCTLDTAYLTIHNAEVLERLEKPSDTLFAVDRVRLWTLDNNLLSTSKKSAGEGELVPFVNITGWL